MGDITNKNVQILCNVYFVKGAFIYLFIFNIVNADSYRKSPGVAQRGKVREFLQNVNKNYVF